MTEYLHKDLTAKIIELFYKVYNTLGYGFSEKIYEKALVLEMNKAGMNIELQEPVQVKYDGHIIGTYIPDMIVEEKVIIEIKAVAQLIPAHEAQLLNYLKASGKEVGLLLNFGQTPEIKRKILTRNQFE